LAENRTSSIDMVRIATIGFTKKSAEEFFAVLKKARVKRVLDVRLNNQSQLAGFSKRDDLAYFLKTILNIEYLHLAILAPTQEMLDAYRKAKGSWSEYEKRFLDLMAQREIERELDPALLDDGCLLCSEDKPHQCHRRFVAEYLNAKWRNVRIEHLV
jgi:uncharacterized protein (DUF488 family)